MKTKSASCSIRIPERTLATLKAYLWDKGYKHISSRSAIVNVALTEFMEILDAKYYVPANEVSIVLNAADLTDHDFDKDIAKARELLGEGSYDEVL